MTTPDLFARFFLPLYPADAASDLAGARAVDANPGNNPALIAHLADAAARFVSLGPGLFGSDPNLDFSDASVHRMSALWTPDRLETWGATGAAGSAENALFNAIVHGAAYVGECIVKNHGARWLVRRPLWESRVYLTSAAGEAELAPFSWLVRSSERQGPTLADRYRTYVEVPVENAMTWPTWLVPRTLPPLKRPTYSTLYKYLRAQLAELRDVGKDFPSAERFDELRFRSLAFSIVGEGRAVIAYGVGEHGLSAFWFGDKGFIRAMFIPCDAEGGVELTTEETRVRFAVKREERPLFHETMWWGP